MAQINTTILGNIKDYIHRISELFEGIETNDLGELAKIHEFAMKIDEQIRELSEPSAELFSQFCRTTATIVEGVILESYTNPQDLLNQLSLSIQEIIQSMDVMDGLPEESILRQCNATVQVANPATDQNKAAVSESQSEWDEQNSTPETHLDASASNPESQVSSEPTKLHLPDYKSEPLVIAESEFEYVQSFLTECQEHIENIESGLLTLEQTPNDLNKINELFRPFHTIKGMAGFLNLKDVQALTHEVETLLDLSRKGKLSIKPSIIDLVFEALDILKVQISAIGEYIANPNGGIIPQPPIGDIIHRVAMAAQGRMIPPSMGSNGKTPQKKPIGEILAEESEVSPELVEFALQKQKGSDKPVGTILTEIGAVSAKDVSKALRKQKGELQDTVVRVDTAKLDNLVNLVGEMVIIQTQVEQNETVRTTGKLSRLLEQVSKITRDVQEIAMSMRMVPLSQTFHKMGRVLRDLARKIDKKITYEVDGEETELDKNMIQELSDPLMHMIRNAVDHGIEMPADRVKAGKSECGTVTLRAYHQGGNIVIEVSDDGKGLDKDVLISKGIEKGLISPDAQLTEQQAFNLIMAPGFSTAEKITDISGRGVGMDVVKKNIEKLRGKVEIRSVKGKGTTFTIRLPLTLAVIDGMIIRVGSQKFVLPTLSIIQALSPTADQVNTVQEKGMILNLRGKIYPLITLGNMFNIPDAVTDPVKGMVVIAQAEDRQIGLVLDELLGQQQVVIKSLGDRFKKVRGITGGAILGDGTIGLIIEPAGLLDVYQQEYATV